MEMMRFTPLELLSLAGLTQCLYILVYMGFRGGKGDRVFIPILYFGALCLAFTFDFVKRYIGDVLPFHELISLGFWFYGPPLSVLLIIQVIRITKEPPKKNLWLIFLVPFSAVFAYSFTQEGQSFIQWFKICGIVTGALSLLTIWMQNKTVSINKLGASARARYWLVVALLVMNISFLSLMVFSLGEYIPTEKIMLIRSFLGLGFIYVAMTSLFRIFPQAVRMHSKPKNTSLALSDKELEIAFKIEGLLELEKVYQEPGYSRADLAKECYISEATLSKIINNYFEKTFPQLMNERRVADAKRLLRQTEATSQIIAREVGFNSLPSFNRVFKEITGKSPSYFKKE